ncbi:hypothetical protein H2Y56_00515 [Pectobacterium aroidearum]|uniref:HEPN domain-containing protein n=1 Tax=Pectobacterium aroidearum TaxID=1201031 RepID=A0ABR5Z7T0_9GAMM|nr:MULTISPECIES: hypothetical protein [Pectobacterium]MBA5197806.1 hypothetical protein [Pectobacterium aroidearum]MBA5230599.1 hypothetical protein [Pectobacterium aroidearum]GKV95428.1 hypothetical protein PEC301645_28750 [Pectobacterium carotovorum subsp. carotovorum]
MWTLDYLRRLDKKYAEEGVHVHQRPLKAAMDILGTGFNLGPFSNPELKRIIDAYTAMMPEVETSWPGAGIGLIASMDQVRKTTFPILFGENNLQVWEIAGFSSNGEWWEWCRKEQAIATEVSFAIADIHDFTMGLNKIEDGALEALTLWKMSRSNLEDIANTLPNSFSHDSVIQPICMVAELSFKAALVLSGVDLHTLKGKNGHNLIYLAQAVMGQKPHRDDRRIKAVIDNLPPYVASRYKPAGLKRLQVVRLALGVQFIAASTLRRITTSDLAIQMESEGYLGSRPDFTI